jgi:hypothetical protein
MRIPIFTKTETGSVQLPGTPAQEQEEEDRGSSPSPPFRFGID